MVSFADGSVSESVSIVVGSTAPEEWSWECVLIRPQRETKGLALFVESLGQGGESFWVQTKSVVKKDELRLRKTCPLEMHFVGNRGVILEPFFHEADQSSIPLNILEGSHKEVLSLATWMKTELLQIHLDRLVSAWGPNHRISVAVLASSREDSESVSEFVRSHAESLQNVDLHLVHRCSGSSDFSAVLRIIARELSKTPQVFSMDEGYLPSEDLFHSLQKLRLKNSQVFIVPACKLVLKSISLRQSLVTPSDCDLFNTEAARITLEEWADLSEPIEIKLDRSSESFFAYPFFLKSDSALSSLLTSSNEYASQDHVDLKAFFHMASDNRVSLKLIPNAFVFQHFDGETPVEDLDEPSRAARKKFEIQRFFSKPKSPTVAVAKKNDSREVALQNLVDIKSQELFKLQLTYSQCKADYESMKKSTKDLHPVVKRAGELHQNVVNLRVDYFKEMSQRQKAEEELTQVRQELDALIRQREEEVERNARLWRVAILGTTLVAISIFLVSLVSRVSRRKSRSKASRNLAD
jgi:hypothetical protein